jgi:UDP-N-acetylglucosamine 2-epimerase (non-hydrolysing)
LRILHVVGARPNFMKAAPVIREMAGFRETFKQLLLHTGQHYDPEMSQIFFEELELPKPDINLGVGSGSHVWQTTQVMQRFEPILLDFEPDWVVVYGDVNSTLACSLVSSKLNFAVAHVEAGLRSFNRSMPEEINRLLTDQLSDLLFTPSQDADLNLAREGIQEEKVHMVGNVMIDTLVHLLPKAQVNFSRLSSLHANDRYILVTLHRPSNVDHPATLQEIMTALETISTQIRVIFPVHPRTKERIKEFGIATNNPQMVIMEPLGYLDFLALQTEAALVLTDSGGIQEETTFLGIPCLTARSNTERPITISLGTNRLVESKADSMLSAIQSRLEEPPPVKKTPPLWDGHTAQRIAQVFMQVEAA